MSRVRVIDRMESSLFDRLTASTSLGSASGETYRFPVDQPASHSVSRHEQTRRLQQIGREIERDTLLLLQTRQAFGDKDLVGFPHLQNSVLTYGMPCFEGLTSSGYGLQEAASIIAKQLARFEPRFHSRSVQVECQLSSVPGEWSVEIHALYGPEDHVQEFSLRSTVRVSTDHVAKPFAA